MEMRNSALEKVAVKKVKHEVDSIIEEARTKLEQYVEDESDLSLLAETSNSLAQVERTLQLVQINGAAVLAREMCDVVEGLMNENIAQKNKAQECLSRGILQMSDYLEYVQAGHKDLPVVLLPLLNDLRGVREAPLLSEHILFFPDLDDIDVPNVHTEMEIPAQEYAKKIRYGFQTGLVNIIQNKEIDAAATKICKVAIRLHQCSREIAACRLWWVSSAVAQALAIGALSTSTGIASLLGQVDRQIKRFIELDEASFAKDIPTGLIKNLLYYVGIAEDRGRIVSKVKLAYGLNDLIPTEMDIDNMREGLSGPNSDVLEAVSKALHEDIETVKDAIELYVHSKNRSPESVKEVGKELQKIADTLSMLGLDEPREEVLREVTALNGLSVEELEHADSNFIAIAETLIKAENIVDNFVNYRILNKPAVQLVDSSEDHTSSSDDANQFRKIQVQTITEALIEIEEAKNTFSQLLTAPEDEEKFAKVQDNFRKVMGVLAMLNLDDAAKILECIQAYLLDKNAVQELGSNAEKLDALADSITSVECYLEALIVDEGDPKDILEYGVKNASLLVDGELALSENAQPLKTVEVEEFEEKEDDGLALLSSSGLELKKKSKITESDINTKAAKPSDLETDDSNSQKESSKPHSKTSLDDELSLEELSATSIDLSIDFDLLDEQSNDAEHDSPNEELADPEPINPEPINPEAISQDALDETELLDLSETDEELAADLIELESTSIEEAATELNSIANEAFDNELALDLDDEDEAVGVVEVDLDATNMLDLEEIEEELNTNAKAYDLDNLEDSQADDEGKGEEIISTSEEAIELQSYSVTINDNGLERALFANRNDAEKEVVEIFIEEAEEEVEKINLNRKIWQDDQGNQDALTIVRRSFHTLKGSGRLVGAEIIGEYSWLIENILNKVIDQSLAVTSDIHDLLERSVALLNELVLQIKTEREPVANVVELYKEAQNFIDQQNVSQKESQKQDLEQEEFVDRSEDSAIQSNIEVVNLNFDELEVEEQQDSLHDELYSLFLEEASQHISTIEEIIERKKDHKILPIDETLLHALHTLFGCSRTAQVGAVAKLIGPLDKFCQECAQNNQKLKAEQFDVFVECIEYVKQGITDNASVFKEEEVNLDLLDKINDLKIVEIPVLDDVVADEPSEDTSQVFAEPVKEKPVEDELVESQNIGLEKNRSVVTDEIEEADVYDGKDADLVEIFLEEAADILEACNQCLEKWRTNHKDENAVSEFRRQLHTLKGSARMATYSNIGNLSHTFENLVISIVENRVNADEDIFNIVQRCLDHLNEMVDLAVAKQPVPPASVLIQNIDALLSVDDSFVGVPPDTEPDVFKKEESTVFEETPVFKSNETDAESSKIIKIPVLRDPIDIHAAQNTQPLISGQQAVRLQSNVLDNLVNNAGEVNIFQARLEQVSNNYNANIYELDQVVNRLREQLRNLEIETETQILSRHAHEAPEQEDFDPLELDRYSNIQQLSRSLAESVNDLLSIKDILSDQVRESEMLLMQQRRISGDLQEGLMRTRMVQFNQLVPRLQRIVRQTSRELEKRADLKVVGQNTEIDSSILNRIVAPLEHLVRNAISHGIENPDQRSSAQKSEAGEIEIEVTREGAEIIIVVKDDGAGLDVEKIKNKAQELGLIDNDNIPDREALNLILTPGFSTAGQVSQVSGRGVGMDVVASEIKQLGGALQIDTVLGQGATFTIHIPFTLAITQSLLVKCANDIYAVPLASVEGVVRMSAHELKQKYAEESAVYNYADRSYRLCHLASLLGLSRPQLDGADKMFPVLLVRSGKSRMAIHVEATLGNHEIVVKPLAAQLSRLPAISGATILGDGNVVLILDVQGLVRMDSVEGLGQLSLNREETIVDAQPTIMVVDDSITIRKVTTRFLERNHYKVTTAKDGVDAVQKLQDFTPALILLDIEMPRMDGFELATHVRNNERLKNVPIIMITSRTGDKHRQRALDIGVQEYLGKPYNEGQLLDCVREVVK